MQASEVRNLLSTLLERSEAQLTQLIKLLPSYELRHLEALIREELEALPIPIEPSIRLQHQKRREALTRALYLLEARRGEPQRLIYDARQRWLNGGAHLDYLQLMRAFGRHQEVIDLAFALLIDRELCPELADVERLLREELRIPQGHEAAITRYLEDPSEETLEPLLRFMPAEFEEEQLRFTVATLLRCGADPSLLLTLLLALIGPDAITEEMQFLIDDGALSPQVMEALAEHHPDARVDLLGFAARSAQAQGDHLGTIRYLRVAMLTDAEERARDHLEQVRELADADLLELLDRAGLH